jgi:hypothetical protein
MRQWNALTLPRRECRQRWCRGHVSPLLEPLAKAGTEAGSMPAQGYPQHIHRDRLLESLRVDMGLLRNHPQARRRGPAVIPRSPSFTGGRAYSVAKKRWREPAGFASDRCRSAAIYDTRTAGTADSRSRTGVRMSDDEIDEMIRTAIYLHLDGAHRVMALEWLDERVAVYHAYKSNVNLTPSSRRARTARSA